MKKFGKNKFKIKSKSLSLSKINPYYDNKENYLPYKYKDPTFKTQYNGPLMQKDYYLLNLMNNRLKKVITYKSLDKDELPLIQSKPIEIYKKTDLIFNSAELERQQLIKEYTKFAFSQLKRSFFNFNPVSSKNDLIKYRKNKFKGIPIFKEAIRYNPKTFMMNFQKQINQNNYQNWEKIKEEYEKRELNDPIKNDKYYDENKIWEILNINKRNIKNNNFNSHLTDANQNNYENEQIKEENMPLSENKRICIFKSESKNWKKFFSPIKIKEDGKMKFLQ